MPFDITNYYEPLVVAAVQRYAAEHIIDPPLPSDDLLEDAACIALNRLPTRYIRHYIDASFFLSTTERARMDTEVEQAVHEAFEHLLAAEGGRRDSL